MLCRIWDRRGASGEEVPLAEDLLRIGPVPPEPGVPARCPRRAPASVNEGRAAVHHPPLLIAYESSARARLPMLSPLRIRSKRVSSAVEVLVLRLVISWSL